MISCLMIFNRSFVLEKIEECVKFLHSLTKYTIIKKYLCENWGGKVTMIEIYTKELRSEVNACLLKLESSLGRGVSKTKKSYRKENINIFNQIQRRSFL